MQGSPLLRALVLAAALVAMGVLIASMARRAPAGAIPVEAPPAEEELVATLTVQLSAPARTLSLRTLDGGRSLLTLENPGRESDHPVRLPIRDGHATLLLDVAWEAPGEPNFLRFILEPEDRGSRELILPAPDDLADHAVEFTWTDP